MSTTMQAHYVVEFVMYVAHIDAVDGAGDGVVLLHVEPLILNKSVRHLG